MRREINDQKNRPDDAEDERHRLKNEIPLERFHLGSTISRVAEVYRAPMRSRRDDIDPQAAIERALALGLVGFGDAGADDRLARRVARFADVDDGAFVWTRDTDGLYWLGRIAGPYRRDDDPAAVTVDLVHVRPCRWLPEPLLEPEVPGRRRHIWPRGTQLSADAQSDGRRSDSRDLAPPYRRFAVTALQFCLAHNIFDKPN